MRMIFVSALVSFGLAACSSTVTGRGDDGGSSRDAIPSIDARGVDAGEYHLAPCGAAADCSGVGAECLLAFPGGLCTRACAGDSECAEGVCARGRCMPRCTHGGGECERWGGACDFAPAGDARSCIPSCYPTDTAPSGEPRCVAGTICDCTTGMCARPEDVGPPIPIGAPCTTNFDCNGGDCYRELSNGAPTGYLDGYCFGRARRPEVSTLGNGDPHPLSNCCPGGVPSLAEVDPATGDPALCDASCAVDSDCRPGYHCWRWFVGGVQFSSGDCSPIDCLRGESCPSGTHCVVMNPAGTEYGVCAH